MFSTFLVICGYFIQFSTCGECVGGNCYNLANDGHFIPVERHCKALRYHGKCYLISTSHDDWHDARSMCENVGYRLSQIDSIDEADFLATEMAKTGFNYFWVSANDKKEDGIWKNADGTVAFVDSLWNYGEPNSDWWEDCGEMVVIGGNKGRLNDQHCSAERRYVCERDTDSHCPRSGWKNKCYIFSLHQVTFIEADRQCRSLGMRLARVFDTDLIEFIQSQQRASQSWVDAGGAASSGGHGGDNYVFAAHPMFSGRMCYVVRRGARLSHLETGRMSQVHCNSLNNYVCESLAIDNHLNSQTEQIIDGELPSRFGNGIIWRRRRSLMNNRFSKSAVTRRDENGRIVFTIRSICDDNLSNNEEEMNRCKMNSFWHFV